MEQNLRKSDPRRWRKIRIRKRMEGTAERPRLAVFRSDRHIYVQAIDDISGRTLAAAGTTEKDLTGQHKGGTREGAKAVGMAIAERLKKAGIDRAVFDRGGYMYHGRVAALAEGAREGGLQF